MMTKQSRTLLACVGLLACFAIPVAAHGQITDTKSGSGTLRFGNYDADKVTKIRVILNRNGSMELRPSGEGQFDTIYGTWRSSSPTVWSLVVDGVGNDEATGSGQITHDSSGSVKSVYCSGRSNGKAFELRFDTGRPISSGDKRFTDAARDAILDKFPGYDIRFSNMQVGDEIFGNRLVEGDFSVLGRGSKAGDYRLSVNCGAGTAKVKSATFYRKSDSNGGGGGNNNNAISADDKRLTNAARDAIRDKFPGYDIRFSNMQIGKEVFGRRVVKGDFEVTGRGSKSGNYSLKVICAARSASVISTDYSRTGDGGDRDSDAISEWKKDIYGVGTVAFGDGDQFDITRIKFDLQRDGDAVLDVIGESNYQLTGTWRQDGSQLVLKLFRIRENKVSDPMAVSATLYLRGRNDLDRCSAKGSVQGGQNRSITLKFTAGRG